MTAKHLFQCLAFAVLTSAWPLPAHAQSVEPWTQAEARSSALEAATLIEREYTDAAIGRRIATALRDQTSRGAFDAGDGEAFATRLLEEMRRVYDDKHFSVEFYANGAPPSDAPLETLSNIIDPNAAAWGRFVNGGASRAERLAGNIGYLRIDGMPEPQGGAERAIAAIAFLAETDALIVDLRQCGGGDPAMAAFYQSLLTDGESQGYARFEWRSGAQPRTLHTPAISRGSIYDPGKPIFLLTGAGTISACEELAFTLAERGRVTIVGGTTAGAANPGRTLRAGRRISIFLPSGRYVSAQSGSNWEGVGVAPEVRSDDEAALSTVHRLAVQRVAGLARRLPFQRFIEAETRAAGLGGATVEGGDSASR